MKKKIKQFNYKIELKQKGHGVYADGLDVYSLILILKRYRKTRKIHWVKTDPSGLIVIVREG